MFEFLFPASMAAGGLLVSSPIIIHLINRMRFKRIRWAAMEFLLKSQKRNRRRLIIEQLLLLLLRILLVLLAAFVVARFIGFFFGPVQPQTSQHILLLEDTPSMTDQWLEQGERKTSFTEAKRLIVEEIAKSAAKAGKAQHLKLFTATQPDQIHFDDRLNEDSIKKLATVLGNVNCTEQHVDLIHGVRKARKLFEATPQDQRILYIVGDYRQTDWTGAAGDTLLTELQEMEKQGVHVKFVDVADPVRKEGEKDPNYHDNLAIVGLRPEARVTARNRLTDFTATIVNYSLTERNNLQLRVKLDGEDQADRSVPIPVLRPNERTEVKFSVYIDKLGIHQVSANFPPENTGLQVDNTRYAVIEVREKIPILLIDGDPANSRREGGDTYFLSLMFNANRGVASGYDLIIGVASDLERPNLDQYPSIYLVNVRELNDKAQASLEKYVQDGGNVAFFLGDRVNVDYYNRKLYNNGNGVFPVPLADRPTPDLSPEDRDARWRQNLEDPQYQLFVRNESHPIFAPVWEDRVVRGIFKFLTVDRHWPVNRARWQPTPGKSDELVTLPNRNSVDDYKAEANELLAKLPTEDDRQAKYKRRLEFHRDTIRDVLNGKPLYRLADVIDVMLHERGVQTNADLPNLMEFWGQSDPAIEELRGKFDNLRQKVQYGDPLVVSGQRGKGRVVAWMTSIGRRWNNWAGEFPVSATFPVVMFELQKWLVGGTAEAEYFVGAPVDIQLDAKRYEDKMRRIFKPEAKEKAPGVPDPEQGGDRVMGDQQAVSTSGGISHFRFTDAKERGVYVLEFTQRAVDSTSDPKREARGFAFNIDTAAESNLARVDRGVLMDKVKDAKLYTLGSDQFTDLEQRQRDLSEGPWLYLLFLFLLVMEQALAVHLSYHLAGGQTASTPAPAGAA